MAERTATPGEGDALGVFFTAATSFVANVTKDMVTACGADPDGDLITANGSLVQNQLQKIFDKASSGYLGANQGIRAQVTEYLSVADGTALATIGERTARATLAKGVFGGGFISWISKHLTEIKKIIREILGMIFPKLKDWLEPILILIDELWNMMAELLGGVFGLSRRELARDMSAGEVNSLNEIAATQRLRMASREMERSDDE